MKNVRVMIGGSPYHAVLLSKQFEGIDNGVTAKVEQPQYPQNKLRKVFSQLVNSDIYHGIYWDDCYKTFILAKLLGKKTVCHWIGTDVYLLLRNTKHKIAMKILKRFIDVHLAGSPQLIEELKTKNIHASWMPLIPSDFNYQVPPLPAAPTVLTYIPDFRPEYYGISIVYQLAAHFQDIKFIIVGDKVKDSNAPDNVTFMGFRNDMDVLYANSTVLLRLVEHDGLSLMVLEALARGRQVIYSEQFPNCYYARDFTAAKDALSSIISNPVINSSGVNYMQEELNRKKIIGKLGSIYLDMSGRQA